MNNYWTTTDWPTLEITTSIPKQGCVVDCVFCPQRVLQKIWNEKHFTTEEARTMKLEDFKMVIDKLPKQIRITFSGFTEPWLNRNTSAMLLYAHQALKDANIKNFTTMSMGEVHEEVEHIYPDKIVNKYEMWHRAGNLLGEAQLKPEVKEVFDRFKSVMHNTEKTCGCIEGLYHNILLPNGEVSLCCMDYNLDEILGNLYTQEYDDILPAPNTTYDMCMMCENGVDPVKSKTSIIKTMGEAETVNSQHFFAPDEMVQYLGFDINPEKRVPEADLIQSMRQYIFPNKTFVDVGAHIGTYTWILGPYAQKVYAFEPTQRIYNHLCANIMIKGLSDKVDTYNCGLSSQNGKLPFYERQPDGGTNGFTPIGWKDENTYELPVMKLDEFEIKDISLIKIDVEGHELEVIKGAYETLIDNEYPPILFESWEPEGSQLKGDLRTELFNYLYELGYAIEHTAYPDIFLATRN